MPVPRLFEAASDPRETWVHLLASLLALGGPATRTALVQELSGESLPGADALLVFERRPLGDSGQVADILARGAGWTLVVQATLAFDGPERERVAVTRDVLSEMAKDRAIVIALTPDRRPPAYVEAVETGDRIVRHRSWLRVRDWVQERPERGAAQGVDLLLLREAEYFLTPRVAELYRLEGLMPLVAESLRPTLAAAYLELNDLAPAPLIQTERGAARVAFPRTGDAAVELLLRGGGLTVRVRTGEAGPGFTADGDGGQALAVRTPAEYVAARAWLAHVAQALLPLRR